MKYRDVDGGLLVRFDRGERLPSGIVDLCSTLEIPAATAQGIGALEDIEIGYYDLATKSYERSRLSGAWELVALTTFVATWENKPFAHTHVVLSGRDFSARGGHLFDGAVSITVELRLFVISPEVRRVMNPTTGLHMLDL